MKTVISALCFFCATVAFGQTAAVVNMVAQPFQMAEHTQHASDHPMAQESSLFSATSPYSYAKGEIPLAELGSPIYQVPLGDVARANRIEHASLPKATKISEN